ncbi:SAM-dependent methyltransferase [Amycolatopsis azurea]|uniref:Putative NDP-hexose 3-O-methyltransferase n=1 Tax=Amycolatopsis azurea DSM 43854 TaxID=1238180 RepID=M2PH17_9PSEU|nr:methyltransferase domain-containing protein [Amycolatopsis azurea]EMD23703.1 putative NDP-hexose 3-O-methyltransferase [Amycolatopsis azurea DSM 43854]OOC02967.1 hypothetical protein B0293_28745 [Amycolatopsis azurea DSM 43854]
MADNTDHATDALEPFYDGAEALRTLVGDNFHFGYWDEDQQSLPLDQAQNQLTDQVAAATGLHEGQRLLDVGCGTGAPGFHILYSTGASVTGIAISEEEVRLANAASHTQGLGRRAEFHVADAIDLPFPDKSFDAAIAIESLLHIPDKLKAFKEIQRVLRPGALLVISDGVAREDAVNTGSDIKALEAAMITRETYKQLAADAGFHIIDFADITERVKPTFGHVLQRIDTHRADLIAKGAQEQVDALEEILRFYQDALESGSRSYLHITLRKPTEE